MAFESAQRQYHILLRFINKLRLRRSVLRIQTDLILNPISESHRNVVAVHHNGNKYLFTVMDITKIIESSILNSSHMVSSPIAVKNPYNNLPFTKSSLYNLYFQIKSRDFILSPAFHNYFLCNFNLKRFKLETKLWYAMKPYHVIYRAVVWIRSRKRSGPWLNGITAGAKKGIPLIWTRTTRKINWWRPWNLIWRTI